MGKFNLSYGKVLGGAVTFLPKKVPANRLHDKSKFTNTLNKNNAGAAPALL